jgi:hypothetical protein
MSRSVSCEISSTYVCNILYRFTSSPWFTVYLYSRCMYKTPARINESVRIVPDVIWELPPSAAMFSILAPYSRIPVFICWIVGWLLHLGFLLISHPPSRRTLKQYLSTWFPLHLSQVSLLSYTFCSWKWLLNKLRHWSFRGYLVCLRSVPVHWLFCRLSWFYLFLRGEWWDSALKLINLIKTWSSSQINSVRTSRETHCISATKPNRLMLFRETIVYCENRMKHTNTLCGQNALLVC